MSLQDKLFNRLIWGLLIVVLGGVSVAYLVSEARPTAAQAPVVLMPDIRITLPDFGFTERSKKQVTRDDLLGQVWIADFIFTRCAGPCPRMSSHMQALQGELADLAKLKLVSFTVDPERDTPEVLQEYAARYGADPQRWLFLTGPMDTIYDLAIDGFKITVEAARENNEIIHDTRFMLVDSEGVIRGYYDSLSPEDLDRLRKDAASLVRTGEL